MSIAQPIAGLEKTTMIPERSMYIVEMGDGSGTRAATQETLVTEVGKGLKVGDLAGLQTNAKESLVDAINEAAQSGGSGEQVDILDSKETIEANTTPGKAAGALAVKQMVGALNDKLITKLPGEIKIIAEGNGADVRYYAQLGADTASKKLLDNLRGKFQLSLCPSGAQNRFIHFPTLARKIHIWMIESTATMKVFGVNSITETTGTLLYTAERSGFDTVLDCSNYDYVCFATTTAYNGHVTSFYLEYV